MIKKKVLEHAREVERLIREGKRDLALSEQRVVKEGISSLREAAKTPSPPPLPPSVKPFRVFERISDWHENLQGDPGQSIREVDWQGRKALLFDVLDTDTVVSKDPRAQLGTEDLIEQGRKFYWHGSFWIPSDSPLLHLPPGGWANLIEFFGWPYDNSPPFQVQLWESNGKTVLGWRHNQTYNYAPAHSPLNPTAYVGRWVDYLVGIDNSVDGFVDLWLTDADGKYVNIVPKKPTKVWDGTATKPCRPIIQLYMKKGMFPSAQLYEGSKVELFDEFPL